MSEHFPNAPLVELMVEVRWEAVSPVIDEPVDVGEEFSFDPVSDELFQTFGRKLAAAGYARSERLSPAGFPAPAGMPVYRFSSSEENENSILFQIGSGILSVNAVPPYQSWSVFRPKAALALETLLGSWGEDVRPDSFTKVTLRYINSFTDNFLAGRSRGSFLSDVLGFKLSIPPAYATHLSEETDRNVFLQFSSALNSGGRMAVRAGHATVGNADAIVTDTTVSFSDAVSLDANQVLLLLDSGHEVASDTFIELTMDVQDILRGDER